MCFFYWHSTTYKNFDYMPVLIGGLVVAVFGYIGVYAVRTYLDFDRKSGYYRMVNGDSRFMDLLFPSSRKEDVPLNLVHALQIIRIPCSTTDVSIVYFEMNLVLHNGERVKVIDSKNYTQIKKNAVTLAGFLGVPLWNAGNISSTKVQVIINGLQGDRFNDPIASQIDWEPLNRKRRGEVAVLRKESDRITLNSTICPLIFGWALMVLSITFLLIWYMSRDDIQNILGLLLPSVPCTFCLGFGIWLLIHFCQREFNLNTGFYTSRKKFSGIFSYGDCLSLELSGIYALQILQKHRSVPEDGPLLFYELNIILKDGKRINIEDQTELDEVRSHAGEIAQFLDVPVWDVAEDIKECPVCKAEINLKKTV